MGRLLDKQVCSSYPRIGEFQPNPAEPYIKILSVSVIVANHPDGLKSPESSSASAFELSATYLPPATTHAISVVPQRHAVTL